MDAHAPGLEAWPGPHHHQAAATCLCHRRAGFSPPSISISKHHLVVLIGRCQSLHCWGITDHPLPRRLSPKVQNSTMQAAGDLELSSLPVGPPTEHWLNLITKKMDIGPDAVEDLTNAARRASMKGDSQGLGIDAPANGMPAGRTRVFACVNLHELRNIDPANESFEVRTRLYLCWRPPILHMSPLDDRPALESDEEMDDGEAQSASGSGFDPVKASTGVAAADPAAGSGQGELPRGLHANGHGPGSESQRKSVARSSRTGRRFTMLQKVLR